MFESMKSSYSSAQEKSFFEKIHEKMLSEYAPCGEMLFSPRDNDENIGLHREEYDEFIVGHLSSNGNYESVHVMKLSDALLLDLQSLGYLTEKKTLLEWLRGRDYSGVMYDHNNAYL